MMRTEQNNGARIVDSDERNSLHGCGPEGYFAVACPLPDLSRQGLKLDRDTHGNSYLQVVGFDAMLRTPIRCSRILSRTIQHRRTIAMARGATPSTGGRAFRSATARSNRRRRAVKHAHRRAD
jgi:hypothetical protein